MKALSVQQPWAHLLCAGIKNIENRTWKLPEKYKNGWVLIHASAGKLMPIGGHYGHLFNTPQYETLRVKMGLDFFNKELQTSAIIGAVKFSDCVINHPSIWAEKAERFVLNESWPNGRPASAGKKGDIYNWVVSDAVLFEKPILNVKGRLGFWDYPMTEEEYLNIEKMDYEFKSILNSIPNCSYT